VLVLGGGIGFLLWGRLSILRPIERLHSALSNLELGTHGAPAPESGPVELAEVASTFNRMAARLEHERKERSAIMAAVVHDLRMPLSALRMAASLLKPVGPSSEAEGAGQRTVSLIDRQVLRLDRMLED